MPLYAQWSGSPRRFNALSCFNVRLDSPAPGAIYMPIMLLRRVAFPGFCEPGQASREAARWGRVAARDPLLASQEENEWPREGHTNPFAQPERTGIVRVHQKSQDQPGAKVEPDRRTTAPDRRAHAVHCHRRHQPRSPPLANIKPGSPAPAMGGWCGGIGSDDAREVARGRIVVGRKPSQKVLRKSAKD
jgi:hypothetical protein